MLVVCKDVGMSDTLTALFVHAHPDDEVIPTGGLIALCAQRGIRTVLVTCTDGSQGFGPEFVNSGEPGHDPGSVARQRRAELEESCRILGVSDLELLGYADSGMEGWPSNHDPRAFCRADLKQAAQRVGALIEQYRPQVIVTYPSNGGSGHPDHVNAHLVALAAHEQTQIADKVYFAIRSGAFADLLQAERKKIAPHLIRRPTSGGAAPRPNIDHLITTRIDTSSVVANKKAALRAHWSQLHDSHWLAMSDDALDRIFAEETYIRARDRTGAALPERDLFAGLARVH